MIRPVSLRAAEPADRDDAGAFAGRVARWDSTTPVRLRQDGTVVRMWAGTPFDVLVTRSVQGAVSPADVTVHAGNLLAALAVSTAVEVDPGPAVDSVWRSQLPPSAGWIEVDRLPVRELAELTGAGVTSARHRPGPAGGVAAALLDTEAASVAGAGMRVSIPLRMLFALSAMGFAGAGADEQVKVSATDSWLRLDARFGAVVRRRHALLPLLV